MQVHKRYKLIDGAFSAIEAQEVLLSLLDSKIKYHRKEIFSREVKGENGNTNYKSRLEELMKTYDEIKEVLEQARENGLNLSIISFIDISFNKNKNI